MKSAYELAMERLEKESPQSALSDAQKAEVNAIDDKYKAKIAEREVFLGGKLAEAKLSGDLAAAAEIDDELGRERRTLEARCEEEKNAVRAG
jgi:hypothetical protein